MLQEELPQVSGSGEIGRDRPGEAVGPEANDPEVGHGAEGVRSDGSMETQGRKPQCLYSVFSFVATHSYPCTWAGAIDPIVQDLGVERL